MLRSLIGGVAFLCLIVSANDAETGQTTLNALPKGNFETDNIMLAQTSNTKRKLSTAIEDLQSGSPNRGLYEPMLWSAIRQQKERMDSYFARAGKLKSMEYVGSQNGGDVYDVRFENVASTWWIQISPSGRIGGLVYQ